MLTDQKTPAALEPVMAGLRASAPHLLPFSKTLEIRSYVLEREEGDVLVYSAPGDAGLEGPILQVLNHWHEAAFGGEPGAAPVLAHEDEVPLIPDTWQVSESLREQTLVAHDLWAIPIPGHTPGATAYLWDSGRRRFLFTGDSVYLRGDEWVAAVLDSSDRDRYVESLSVLRELDFDALVPWAATRGRSPVAVTDRSDARRRLDAIRMRVRRGRDQ